MIYTGKHPLGVMGHMPFHGHRTCAEWGPEIDKAHFTEALAKHGNVERAARSIGKPKSWGEMMLRVLAKELGEAA